MIIIGLLFLNLLFVNSKHLSLYTYTKNIHSFKNTTITPTISFKLNKSLSCDSGYVYNLKNDKLLSLNKC
jgi:hypothetical protein